MNLLQEKTISQNGISIYNLLPELGMEEVRKELMAGLFSENKHISSKYFYNEKGSRLFEEITHLEEYYPTRTEKSILRRIAPGLMKRYYEYDIIELGSGDCSKAGILLGAVPPGMSGRVSYYPMDFSSSAIMESALEIQAHFDKVDIEAYVLDFTSQFDHLRREKPALICFFGSTIGNFERQISGKLLENIATRMKAGDTLLLGMDLVKEESVLQAAYNDSKGITEAFNKNILVNVNTLLETDFDPDDFDHLAFFNQQKSRIEMHLSATKDLEIHSPYFSSDLKIRKGEKIHTENSHKYTQKDILEFASGAGLEVSSVHSDEMNWFALVEYGKE